MLHDKNGNMLNAGRRSRKPPAALRRAARERDRYRCRFPGYESRRVDLHHIVFWANGGETKPEKIWPPTSTMATCRGESRCRTVKSALLDRLRTVGSPPKLARFSQWIPA